MHRGALIVVFAVFLASCNATRVVKPLDKGEQQVSATLGGPTIIFSGVPMPMPLSSVAWSYGLDTGVTLTAGLHTTSLLFGVAQTDLSMGITAYESDSGRVGVTAIPGIHLLYDFNEGNRRTYPNLEAVAWWRYGNKPHMVYGGIGSWLELHREKAHREVQQNEFMPYVTLGHQFVREKWNFQIELRYIGFQRSNADIVVDYVGPFNNGTSGIYFGISRKLGKP